MQGLNSVLVSYFRQKLARLLQIRADLRKLHSTCLVLLVAQGCRFRHSDV